MCSRRTLAICLASLWGISSPGCAPEEEAPLEDGLRLKYEWNVVTDEVIVDLTVKRDDEDFVLVLNTEKNGRRDRAALRVDRFFRMKKSGKPAGLGQIPFWMPSSRRRDGGKVVPDGSIRMRKEKEWKGWNCWVGTGGSLMGGGEWYYERETGFLVGFHVESMGSGMTLKLLDTNVPGLQPSEFR